MLDLPDQPDRQVDVELLDVLVAHPFRLAC
jgi:hypothetical protein